MEPGKALKDGRYEIERLLRDAPAKQVYLGQDHILDCAVVVDVIPVGASPVDPPAAAWEARALGRLGDHPNIATVIDHWHESGSAFLVSRYLPGGSLEKLINAASSQHEQLAVDRILGFAMQLAREPGGRIHRSTPRCQPQTPTHNRSWRGGVSRRLRPAPDASGGSHNCMA